MRYLICPAVLLIAACNSLTPAKVSVDPGPADTGSDPNALSNIVNGGGGSVTSNSACQDYNADKNVYWGDLHSHTSFSTDAFSFRTRNSPFDAYAFARGAPLTVAAADPDGGGFQTQLAPGRTLDFEAVTDHSEWLATTYGCEALPDGGPLDPTSPYFNSAECEVIRSPSETFTQAIASLGPLCDGGTEYASPACTQVTESAWQQEQLAAAQANDPCNFTSLVAYEFTLTGLAGAMLHRNVIFASDQVPSEPFDSLDYTTPEALFTALDQSCLPDAGCDVVVIPHNTNLSLGLAFPTPVDQATRAQYAHYERLIEMHQHKGDSECDAKTVDDPFCNFEQYEPALGPGSPVRDGLSKGLSLAVNGGVDPFQFGFVGATDDHDGTPGNVSSETWPGHLGATDDTAEKRLTGTTSPNPGGITGVWAEQNTRPALFAAFKRRETFATSGPRIVLRFFQTWSTADMCTGDFPANALDAGAVPMGGQMVRQGLFQSPSFVVSAQKDQAALAEIDIIKVDYSGGFEHRQVICAAGDRSGCQASLDPSAPCLTWQDPDFDATAPALYYARVLEAPTYRWSHYDCQADPTANPAGCAPDGGLDIQVQQRAWSSPIFWLP